MELVKAKIKGTEDVAVLEKVTDGERVLYRGTGDKVFTADDVEEIGAYDGPYPQQERAEDDPLAQLPQEMVQMITGMVNDYIDRFDRMYWQRQRVEIVKVLMNKLDVATFDPIAITELADKYIQTLKRYD